MSDAPNWTRDDLERIADLEATRDEKQLRIEYLTERYERMKADNALLREFVDAARDELALVIGDEIYTPSDRKPRERAKRTTDAYAALMAAGVMDR
jgi:hypothetical protein